MRYFVLLLIIIAFGSCDYFEERKVSSEDILEESLQSFNWNEIDDYPVFISCDSNLSRDSKKACFEKTLVSHIHNTLAQAKLVVSESYQDTLTLEFIISDRGQIELVSTGKDTYERQLPQLDSLIKMSLDSLPTLMPAIKRGQQVRTRFKMPLIIRTD
ncbi:MAG: hypothetical protein KJO25_08875 [Bacteroidia bacterium]|nr:hypothetical protein [Bacteroidia bacterium]NNK72021.1 hypothetical protein [Flavobacteriaceae bacterium]